MTKLNEKILNYIKIENPIKDVKASEVEKYMLVKTLILANPVIGKITNMSGINAIVNKLERYSNNDLTDYMKNRYKYINIVIREILATEITNDVCKELLYNNIDPIFFDYADDFRITDITHKIIDDYNMNTIVETSWDQNGKTKSLKFNLDTFLVAIGMKTYRPYTVIDFVEDKIFLIMTEDEIINRILKYPIFLNKDIDKLNYIVQNILEP
jgi:hypothetical protein